MARDQGHRGSRGALGRRAIPQRALVVLFDWFRLLADDDFLQAQPVTRLTSQSAIKQTKQEDAYTISINLAALSSSAGMGSPSSVYS
jgi:hypothetical protein